MSPGGSLQCRNERRPLPAVKNCWSKSSQARPSFGSVTFEVIEWFQARVADVKGFAGSRTKPAHESSVRRTAAWTRNSRGAWLACEAEFVLVRLRGCDTVLTQPLPTSLGHPIGRPSRRKLRFEGDSAYTTL